MEWGPGSVRLDACELDHLGPFLDFVGDELFKVGGGTREHRGSQVGEAFLHVGIGKSGIDLLVELLDNLRGRGFGHDDPVPASPTIALLCLALPGSDAFAQGKSFKEQVRERCNRLD